MRTRPFVFFSASSLKRSAALPFGVSAVTTWLNLITMGVCAYTVDTPKSAIRHAILNKAANRLSDGIEFCQSMIDVRFSTAPQEIAIVDDHNARIRRRAALACKMSRK